MSNDSIESVEWFRDRGLLSDFKTGHLILLTTPDGVGVNKIGVEWCRICYALVPEDFVEDHAKAVHGPTIT